MPENSQEASLTEVMFFFGFTKKDHKGETVADPAAFRKEWAELSDNDKADLRRGIGDGTMDYILSE